MAFCETIPKTELDEDDVQIDSPYLGLKLEQMWKLKWIDTW